VTQVISFLCRFSAALANKVRDEVAVARRGFRIGGPSAIPRPNHETRAIRLCLLLAIGASLVTGPAALAQPADQQTIQTLLHRIEEQDRRIEALEAKLASLETQVQPAAAASSTLTAAASSSPSASSPSAPPAQASSLASPQSPAPAALDADAAIAAAQALVDAPTEEMQGHTMEIPGGPTLKIRGFFDFNFGTGSIANPLIFPVATNGCDVCGNPQTPAHSAFQAGEFDLFITSKLSDHLSFIAETVIGTDPTNYWGLDIERYQLTYQANKYFSFTGGRFHTAIGYYNTAYHHGNWFSTAEGRPIMYLFEDSGGVLPVHTVGASMTGLVPKTDNLGLHWIAEIGNGRSSSFIGQPVQNFYSDRNYKATNLALYIRPERLQGLQIGGSYYHDRLAPAGLPRVNQNIGSAYAVYITPTWEFLNEAVLLDNHLFGSPATYRSPMAYTQVSRKFGIYRPYFRYQYFHARADDPVNILQGLFYGPSIGIRMDYSGFAAFKLQYNRLQQGALPAANGLTAQTAFTF
jgi:hypothetical protein